jgi:hypothetical protein
MNDKVIDHFDASRLVMRKLFEVKPTLLSLRLSRGLTLRPQASGLSTQLLL